MSAIAKAHVARLHYLEGLSKQEIAARIGISRFKVARLLTQARTEGIVRIEISDSLPIDDASGRALAKRFGLELAVVVSEPEDIAAAAAAWLPEWLTDGTVLGVGWGSTLSAIATALSGDAEVSTDVVQLCGAIPGLQPGTTPVELTLRFAERLRGQGYVLAAPALASRRAREELLAHQALAPTVAKWTDVNLGLVGIGARLPGAPEVAVGHLLVQSFDRRGRLVDARPAEQAIAIDSDRLRAAKLIAAAGGEAKHVAVLAALRTGLLDVLVCDTATARYALAAEEES